MGKVVGDVWVVVVAAKIVAELFKNGNGDEADRLALMDDGPPKRDLGGWNRLAVRDLIERALREPPQAADAVDHKSEETQ